MAWQTAVLLDRKAEVIRSDVLHLKRRKPCVHREVDIAIDDTWQQGGRRSIRVNDQPIAMAHLVLWLTEVSVIGRIRYDRHSLRADILHCGFHFCTHIIIRSIAHQGEMRIETDGISESLRVGPVDSLGHITKKMGSVRLRTMGIAKVHSSRRQ